jgi:hypothetical protein
MVKLSNERRGELEARLNLLENAQAVKDVTFTTADILANFRENWATLDNGKRQIFIQKFIKKILMHSEAQEGEYHNRVIVDDIQFNDF